MSIERDHGIVLRVVPYSNTSSVVTWFTPLCGRLATLVKGAHRPRSFFQGQLDLFYTCEILYYPGRSGRNLAILKEVASLKTRPCFRTQWRTMLCASYATLLVDRLCPSLAPHPKLFHLLDRMLDALTTAANLPALLFWYELHVLSAMGLAPNLRSCVRCGAGVQSRHGGTIFSSTAGGLLCRSCRLPGDADSLGIKPDVLALLGHWQATNDPLMASRAVPLGAQSLRLAALLGTFLAYHMDALYPGRALALRHAGTRGPRQPADGDQVNRV